MANYYRRFKNFGEAMAFYRNLKNCYKKFNNCGTHYSVTWER